MTRDEYRLQDELELEAGGDDGGGCSTLVILKGKTTPIAPTSLAEQTLAALQGTFRSFGHSPTKAMWSALGAVATTLEAMAEGKCDRAVYVSALDPGVGKTQLVIHFLQALLHSPVHQHISAMVCVSRKDQIRAIAEEAGLREFAVLTADGELNEIGTTGPATARVLFTTQQMVEARCPPGGSFEAVSAFQFMGRPREVRVWDESMIPAQPLSVTLDALRGLPRFFRDRHPDLAAGLDALEDQIRAAADGDILTTEKLPEKFEVSLTRALRLVDDRAREARSTNHGNSAQAETVVKLWGLLGRVVTIRHEGHRITIFDYRDSLADDLRPVLVLDASARVKTTYEFWEKHRGGMIRLPSAVKNYDGLRLHVWNHGGGKGSFETDSEELIEGIAKTINSKPSQEWLVVHFKSTADLDVEADVRRLLTVPHDMVHFLTWGRHDATNAFAHVPNVILAGTLFFPQSQYEALARACAGRPSSSGPFDCWREIAHGEHHSGILQALCRSAVRGCVDGRCSPTDAYLIASSRTDVARGLETVFPGAQFLNWQPVPRGLSGHRERAAFDYLIKRFEQDPDGHVSFSDVRQHVGIKDPKYFRLMRRRQAFVEALEAKLIRETGRSFVKMFSALLEDAV